MYKKMPRPWSFIFWLVFPYIVAKYVAKYWLLLTGDTMPPGQADRLRRKLAGITADIKEATTSETSS
jgi:hypothetical protein